MPKITVLICGHGKGQHQLLTLLHSERPKLSAILAFLSAVGLKGDRGWKGWDGGRRGTCFRFGEVSLFTFLALKFNLFFSCSFLCITMTDVSARIQEEDFQM